ncbi:MAG: amino acid racemase [Saprospiraceae bacterium]|nr:amino acid racemase [Saprospiraceae bacterium]
MKTIGLIGGMSWESSRWYYTHLNVRAKEILGGAHSAKCIMISVDFAEIERLTFEGEWDAIGLLMKDAALQLERAGADLIVLCTNTIHLVSDYITRHVTIPFLHIAEATGQSIVQSGLQRVALLGTKFTMEKDFYIHTLTLNFGLDVLVPGEQEREVVHDIIYHELVHGKFTEASRNKIIQIMDALVGQGAQGIILGCTELPLLVRESDVVMPIFDTARLHADHAMRWSVEGLDIPVRTDPDG